MVVTNMRCGVLLNFELYGSCPMSLALFVFVYLGGYLCICLWQRSDWLNQFWTIGRVMSLHPGAQEHRGFLPVQSIWSQQCQCQCSLFDDQILIRFYEEGDAASLVIPVNSQFRKNIDWLDDNFPREVKNLSTTIFKSKTICLFDNNFRERQKDVLYQKEKKRKYQLSLCT